MNRNGIGNIRNDAARRQLEVAAGVRRDMGFAADVRREELNKQAEELGQSMMAQAETLPSGILASSPELQQTAMAMANGGPVQRFANGNQVRTGRKLTLSDLYRTPLATSEDESIYGGDPAELPTLRAAAMREGVGSFFGNIPRQAAEFIASKPRFRPKQFADLFGVSSARAQDMGSPTDLNVSDTIVNEASTPSVSLTDTGIERPKEPEDFLPPDITNPIVNVDELSFTQSLFSPAAAKARAARNKADRERRRKSTLAQNLAGITNPGFGMIPQDPTKVTDEIVTDPAEEDTTSLAGLRDIQRAKIDSLSQDRGDRKLSQFVLQQATLDDQDRPGISDAIKARKEELDKKTKSALLGEANKARKDPINSTRAAKVAEKSTKGGGGDASTDTLPDSDTETGKNREKSIKDTVTSLFKLDSKETGNIILEAVGEKKEEKLEDRIKKYKKIAEDIFGEDIEGEKTERAYNLAFLGFAIAAGDSPNALSNISKGLLSATKKFNDSAERKRRRKQKIKEFALSESLKDARDQKKFLRDTALQRDKLANRLEVAGINNTAAAKIAAGRLYGQLLMNAEQIKSAQKIADDKNASTDKKQKAINEIARLELERKGIPKFQLGLYAEFKNRIGRDIRPEDFDTKEFDKIKKDYTETFKSFQNLKQSAASMALGDPAQTTEFLRKNLTEIRRLARKQLKLKPGQDLRPEQLREFAARFIREVKPTQRISIDATGNERTQVEN